MGLTDIDSYIDYGAEEALGKVVERVNCKIEEILADPDCAWADDSVTWGELGALKHVLFDLLESEI